jgi:hypothetical protein
MLNDPRNGIRHLGIAVAALAVAVSLTTRESRAAERPAVRAKAAQIGSCAAQGCYGSGPVLCRVYDCGGTLCGCDIPRIQ